MNGKKILQNLCNESLGWNDKVPYSIINEWWSWKEKLYFLQDFQLERCLKSTYNFDNVVEISFHHLSDASERRYR